MVRCNVKGCLRRPEKDKDHSFFLWPKTEKIRQLWKEFAQFEGSSNNLRICSDHFDRRNIKKNTPPKRLLVPNAVPTLLPPKNILETSGTARIPVDNTMEMPKNVPTTPLTNSPTVNTLENFNNDEIVFQRLALKGACSHNDKGIILEVSKATDKEPALINIETSSCVKIVLRDEQEIEEATQSQNLEAEQPSNTVETVLQNDTTVPVLQTDSGKPNSTATSEELSFNNSMGTQNLKITSETPVQYSTPKKDNKFIRKGLGKNESGITDAIKPKLKFDKAGIGHDSAEQFTHHWWEDVFNTAAKNISVDSDTHGVSVKVIDKDMVDITTSKSNLKALRKHNKLHYDNFLKTSTLLNDGTVVKEMDRDPESTHRLERETDYTQLTDEDLFEACGGRTMHKGARHGLNLHGKLARIAEQEKQLLAERALCKIDDVALDDFKIAKRKSTKNKRKILKDVGEIVGCVTTQPSCSYGIKSDTREMTVNYRRPELKGKRNRKKVGKSISSPEELSSISNPTACDEYSTETDVTDLNEPVLHGNANAVEHDNVFVFQAATRRLKQRTKSKKSKKKQKRMINDLTEQLDATCTIDESTETLRKCRRLESQKIIEDVLTTALEICSLSTRKGKKQNEKDTDNSGACEFHKSNRKISKKKQHAHRKRQKDKMKQITKNLMSVNLQLDINPVKEIITVKSKMKQRHLPDDIAK